MKFMFKIHPNPPQPAVFLDQPPGSEKGFFVSIVRDIALERIRDALLADVQAGGLSDDAWTQFCFSRDGLKRVGRG